MVVPLLPRRGRGVCFWHLYEQSLGNFLCCRGLYRRERQARANRNDHDRHKNDKSHPEGYAAPQTQKYHRDKQPAKDADCLDIRLRQHPGVAVPECHQRPREDDGLSNEFHFLAFLRFSGLSRATLGIEGYQRQRKNSVVAGNLQNARSLGIRFQSLASELLFSPIFKLQSPRPAEPDD